MRVNLSGYWSKRVVVTTYQGFSPHDVCGQMARRRAWRRARVHQMWIYGALADHYTS
jgi:hypothetical protein